MITLYIYFLAEKWSCSENFQLVTTQKWNWKVCRLFHDDIGGLSQFYAGSAMYETRRYVMRGNYFRQVDVFSPVLLAILFRAPEKNIKNN